MTPFPPPTPTKWWEQGRQMHNMYVICLRQVTESTNHKAIKKKIDKLNSLS